MSYTEEKTASMGYLISYIRKMNRKIPFQIGEGFLTKEECHRMESVELLYIQQSESYMIYCHLVTNKFNFLNKLTSA